MIKITAVMDNNKSENKALIAEHGLSFYIQTDHYNFLFDCGGGQNTCHNAEKLTVDVANIQTVICSHSHYDHSGGLKHLVGNGFHGKVYTGKGFFHQKYAFDGLKYTYLGCGYDHTFFEKNNIEHIQSSELLKIAENIYLLGSFEQNNDFEPVSQRFYIDKEGDFEQDQFSDEICCVIDTPNGLVVVVGCSHPGIINMLDTIKNQFNKPIYGLFGGIHLKDADQSRIQTTIETMEKYGIKILGTSHCSGDAVREFAVEHTSMKVCGLSVGDSIII